MARYCFYCGRALDAGEKCQCRTQSQAASSAQSSSEYSAAGQPAAGAESREQSGKSSRRRSGRPAADRSTNKSKPSDNPFKAAFRSSFGSDKAQGTTSQTDRQPKRKAWAGSYATGHSATHTRPSIKLDKDAVWAGLHQFTRYLIKPADTIRQAAQFSDRRRAFVLLTIQSLLGGLFMLLSAYQPQIGTLLQLTITNTRINIPFLNGLFLFIQGMGLSLAAGLLMALLTYVLLRWVYHQPVDLIRLISALSPSVLYFTLFLLAALPAMTVSLIHSLLLIAAGFALAVIAVFLALRQLTGLDENKVFAMTAMILLVYAALMSMLLGLAVSFLSALLDQSVVM